MEFVDTRAAVLDRLRSEAGHAVTRPFVVDPDAFTAVAAALVELWQLRRLASRPDDQGDSRRRLPRAKSAGSVDKPRYQRVQHRARG